MNEPPIIELTGDDLDGALGLSMQAGWNQTREDWRRLLELSPRGCLGIRDGGRLVATASAVVYGSGLAWIGMVLVDRRCRGGGLGKRVFSAALERAEEMGARTIGLDATELGRPMYLKFGFRDVGLVERWTGRITVTELSRPRQGVVAPLGPGERAAVFRFDRQACGCDRSRLLERLLDEPDARAWVWRRAEEEAPRGFAVVRPGRDFLHLGPVVVSGETGFEELLLQAGRVLSGSPILADVLHGQELGGCLKRFGLGVQRRLIRKSRPRTPSILSGPAVRLGAGFEWG